MTPILDHAPIAVFAYRRAAGLGRMLDTLQACPEYARSPVFVFSDGPKTPAADKDVKAVRALLAARRTPNMTIVEAPENRGLAASIIGGVDQLTKEYGHVIVIEDDLRLSPVTLTWMNAALRTYAEDERVMQVSAHAFVVEAFSDRREALFLPFTTTWGWATWRRAWEKFDPNATGWQQLRSDDSLKHRFDLNGSAPYSRMLCDQMEAGIDSWGIRWYWSVFKHEGLVLYPPRSIIKNHGVDFKATHGVKSLAIAMVKGLFRPAAKEVPTFPLLVAVGPDEFVAVSSAISKGRI
ncbi:MAG: glycosyltransferase [Alphaproteobacteria bacterium]|nr:glycosyltransferase [Alphaproteobacteria bacterium]MBU1525482.1 glycosyltransferase [Alphaproteobacteria bacterium]MBU2116306.1 glycosyltransferase [Alphaproteobacteria bacterium]MBU2350884.1 glycosyltransferase [Alphaproteobacteria bacterium]MBU2381735.1 glycosyltransferase [Alphaproteobacteria bacterium]